MRRGNGPAGTAVVAVALVAMAALAACSPAVSSSRSAATTALAMASPVGPSRDQTTPAASSPGCFSLDESIDRLPDTVTNLAPQASAIVVARMDAIEPARWNTVDGAQPSSSWRPGSALNAGIVTPARVTVIRPLAGEPSGERRVATEGGTVGCVTHDVRPSPSLATGATYVLFLFPARHATGDPWPDLMLATVAWPVDGDTVRSELEGTIPLARLARLITNARP